MDTNPLTAVTIGHLFGILDILAGLLLVAAILTFGSGLVTYFNRLALAKRDESIITLEWGVRLMFVLVVMLGIVEYVQTHTTIVLEILAVAVVAGIAYAIAEIAKNSAPPDDHH